MRFSELLRKNIISTYAGRIINTSRASRVYTLFFEDLLANYIQECERSGYNREIREIAEKWMNLITFSIPSFILKRLPFTIFFNVFLKNIWINIGGIEDLYLKKRGDIINIETKKEFITRIIGENEFSTGVLKGIIVAFCNCQLECIRKAQTTDSCNYVFQVKQGYCKYVKSKNINVYNKLNSFHKKKGLELKSTIKKRVFIIGDNNKIYFRGKTVMPIENTLFHLLSNGQLLADKTPHISYNFFRDIIGDTSKEAKLKLLKNILQITGWGMVSIAIKGNKIVLIIKNLPYGLQTERDNWDFITRVILGYLWTIDKYSIKNTIVSNNILTIEYTISGKDSMN